MVKQRKKRATPTPTSTEPPGSLVTVDERVDWIRGLMVRLEWDTKKHQRELSLAWNVTPSQVRQYSAEANRSLKLDPEELAQLKYELGMRWRDIYFDAIARCHKISGLPDYGSAGEALDKWGAYSGIKLDAADASDARPREIKITITPEPKK